jgi:hypothetical protein
VRSQRRRRGRPPTLGGLSDLVAVRLPRALLEKVDRFTTTLELDGKPATRADAIRHLLQRGLADRDRARAELRESLGDLTGALAGRRQRRRPRRSR